MGKSLWKLILRTRADGCTGLASMLAYNFFLTVMGVLILAVSVLAYVPVDDLGALIVGQLEGVLPTDALGLIDRTLARTFDHGRFPILVVSLVGTTYVMSNGYHGLISSLNHIYRLRETRPWVRVRLRALIMSLIAAVLILASMSLVMVAPSVGEVLSEDQGISETISLWMGRIRIPVIILLAVAGVETAYRYGPNGGPRWRFLMPGTIFAAGAWLGSTLAFGYYVDRFGTYESVYGTLGAVIVMLTWMWISAVLVLIGAEVNAMLIGGRIRVSEDAIQMEGVGPDV